MDKRSKSYNRILCAVLAIALFITGMCFEQGKADSSFSYANHYPVQETLQAGDSYVEPAEACTHEMLSGNTQTSIVAVARKSSMGVTARILFSIASAIDVPSDQFVIYKRIEKAVTQTNRTNTVIIQYIHEQDGEKDA